MAIKAPVQLLDARGHPMVSSQPERSRDTVRPRSQIKARFDAAALDAGGSAAHWANSDDLSAAAANDPETRRILRRRSRYETQNNSYLRGITNTFAQYLLQTGPRLNVRLKSEKQNRRITESWEEWTESVNLSEKLLTYKVGQICDGESFLILQTNPEVEHAVQLDLLQIDPEMVSAPWQTSTDNEYECDGIYFDPYWNVREYTVLKNHPGDNTWSSAKQDYTTIPARYVLHYYVRERALQYRGIPPLVSSLPLFAHLRRWEGALLSGAELASDFSAVLESTLPPESEFEEGIGFEELPITKKMMVTLPPNYKLNQMRSENPPIGFADFKKQLIQAIARAISMPYCLAAGDSSLYNYSSAKIDFEHFFTAIQCEQYIFETRILNPLFKQWILEARLAIPGLIPDGKVPKHVWLWQIMKNIEPLKESQSEVVRLSNGTDTYANIWANRGIDWRDAFAQQKVEKEYAESLGLQITSASEPEVPEEAEDEEPPVPRKKKAAAVMNGSMIHAIGENSGGDDVLTFTAPVNIQAASGDKKRPRFSIVGYSGNSMSVEGYFYPLIIDLQGVQFPKSQEIPVLRSHDLDRIIGITDSIVIKDKIELTGMVTGQNQDTQEVISQAAGGFKWQSSIGATVQRREFLEKGSSVTVNGREVQGPMILARSVLLREISFVSLGADGETSATLSASAGNPLPGRSHDVNFEDWLKLKGFENLAALSDAAKKTLRAQYDVEQGNPGNQNPPSPPPPSPPVRAEGGNGSGGRQTLEQVVQAQMAEDKRVEAITSLAAQAIADRPDQVDVIQAMAQASIDGHSEASAFELEVLRLRAKVGGASPRGTDRRMQSNVVECALARNAGLDDVEKLYDQQTLEASERAYPHGLSIVETLQLAAHENGAGRVSARDIKGLLMGAFQPVMQVRAFGYSSISLPGILSNIGTKALVKGFTSVDTSWRSISSRRSVKNFHQHTSYALVSGGDFEMVPPTGDIKHTTMTELPYGNRAFTYGTIIAITRTDLVNDDLSAFSSIGKALGRSCALKKNETFYTTFLNNSTFFSAAHGNVLTGPGSVLSLEGLEAATILFENQTGPDGFPLGVTPKILLVPTALKIRAQQLVNSTLIANTTVPDTTQLANNPFSGAFVVISSPYLSNPKFTGASSTAWYLLSDVDEISTIETAFLNGRETPIFESADASFDTLGIQSRCYSDWGHAMQEFRGGVRAAGV